MKEEVFKRITGRGGYDGIGKAHPFRKKAIVILTMIVIIGENREWMGIDFD